MCACAYIHTYQIYGDLHLLIEEESSFRCRSSLAISGGGVKDTVVELTFDFISLFLFLFLNFHLFSPQWQKLQSCFSAETAIYLFIFSQSQGQLDPVAGWRCLNCAAAEEDATENNSNKGPFPTCTQDSSTARTIASQTLLRRSPERNFSFLSFFNNRAQRRF